MHMINKNKASLQDLLQSLALDAIRIQEVINEYTHQEQEAFIAYLSTVPEAWRPYVSSLGPQACLVRELDVSARIQWRQARESGVGIYADLLHLSADIRYYRDQASDSFLNIHIQQIPHSEIISDTNQKQS